MCTQCEVLYVNGVKTHEHGCPLAHQDEQRECKWCGSTFTPEFKHQEFCEHSCYAYYNNLDYISEEEEEEETTEGL